MRQLRDALDVVDRAEAIGEVHDRHEPYAPAREDFLKLLQQQLAVLETFRRQRGGPLPAQVGKRQPRRGRSSRAGHLRAEFRLEAARAFATLQRIRDR